MSEAPAPAYTSRRWPLRRLMRAAYLLGSGADYAEVAEDEFIKSSAYSVRRNLNRWGIRIRDGRRENMRFDVSSSTLATLDQFGGKRGVMPDEIARRVMEILGSDPELLQNVLDDQ